MSVNSAPAAEDATAHAQSAAVGDAAPQPNQAPAEKTDAEAVVNNSEAKNAKDAEPTTKVKRSKSTAKRVDDLAAAEARAVCGEVDTSVGRQLRKREPPPKVEAKAKPPARTPSKKESPAAKKEPPAKRAREAKGKESKEEDEKDSPAENSTDGHPKDDVAAKADALTQVAKAEEAVASVDDKKEKVDDDKPAAAEAPAAATAETPAIAEPVTAEPAAAPAASE